MPEGNSERDLPLRHPNDTVQVIAIHGGRFLLVEQPSRMGGPCWELPGGSYQLNRGLTPEEAAVATLAYQTGIRVPASRASVIFVDHPWNGLDQKRNECAGARVYVVVINLQSSEMNTGATPVFHWLAFRIGEVGAPGFRLDWFAHAALHIYRTQHGGLKAF